MSSFLVLSEGDTRNRWRDGQVCPDVGQGTMAPWARRLGCALACYAQIGRGRRKRKEKERREKRKKERREETEKEREGDGKREEKQSGRERERSPPCMEKRAETGDWSGKTMNAGGVENRID
ncbi:hypothetical protein TNCV_1718881 [Trichonephila clavipes]|nr:hypothetical protein TNCV_1718881 [Trichonephila clavipes]